MVVVRSAYLAELARLLRRSPSVTILGPRQAGKSTIAREIAGRSKRATVLDLERVGDFARLEANAEADLGALQRSRQLIVLDEVQRLPSLFATLRPLLDDPRRRARYLLLGSASPGLVSGVSESLAGRTAFLDLAPFAIAEVGDRVLSRLWTRGGFPPSFLARSGRASAEWREDYVRAFVERDLPTLGLRLPATAMRRFWTMVAHVHGGVLNQSELARSMGLSVPTISHYLDVLEGTFVVRRVPPYFANVGKRLVKSPRVYVRDSGLLHALLGLDDEQAVRSHPKAGASWEGFVIEQVLASLRLAGERPEPHFWRTHAGAEVDLLVRLRNRIVPIEIKLGTVPTPHRGLFECMKDLDLRHGFVLHTGTSSFPLGSGGWALPVSMLASPAALLRFITRPRAT